MVVLRLLPVLGQGRIVRRKEGREGVREERRKEERREEGRKEERKRKGRKEERERGRWGVGRRERRKKMEKIKFSS